MRAFRIWTGSTQQPCVQSQRDPAWLAQARHRVGAGRPRPPRQQESLKAPLRPCWESGKVRMWRTGKSRQPLETTCAPRNWSSSRPQRAGRKRTNKEGVRASTCVHTCLYEKDPVFHVEKTRLHTNIGRLTPDGRFASLLFPSLTQVFISKYSIINTYHDTLLIRKERPSI